VAFLLASLVQILSLLHRFGVEYEAVAKSGRIAAAVVMCLSLISYILAAPVLRYRRVLYSFVLLLGISALWFLLEITLVEPFVSFRLRLYADIYESFFQGDEGDFSRSGLSPFLHNLGYQVSFFLSVLFVMQTQVSHGQGRTLRFAALLLGFTALYFSAQRSAFFAVAASVAIFFFYRRSLRQGLASLVVLSLVAGGLLAVTSAGSFETDYLQASVVQKLLRPEYWSEAVFRFELQKRALELIVLHPFGLPDLGDWVAEGFWPVFAESNITSISSPIAVHNSYLGVGLECGVPFLALCAWFLIRLLRSCHGILTRISEYSGERPLMAQAVVSGAPGLFILQSSTHNSSLFTQDISCMVMFSLVVATEILLKSHK